MKINDAVFGAVLIALCAAIFAAVQSYPTIPGQSVGPSVFPRVIAAGLGVCGMLLCLRGLRARGAWVQPAPWWRSRRHVLAVALVVGGTVAFIVFAQSLGFLVVAPLFLAGLFLVFGVRPVLVAPMALGATLAIHYAFYKLLKVPLPWGLLTPIAW